ncbi:MAG: sialate O-acetylesterase [Verrucomicrobiota bacterium]|nr:sialate O-acetylesterase [Verrucomicrobiota bacterium]
MKFHTPSKYFVFLICLALLSSAFTSSADVTLPRILGSGMVLQRNLPVPLWGWADANEKISVTFARQTRTTTAGKNGKWMVKLDPLKASNKPTKMAIEGQNKITLENILVGEVWICSGQSNMEWSVRASMNAKEEIAAANHAQIRLFNVPGHTTSPVPNEKAARPGSWQECSPKTAPNFSAVGYFFGRRLHKELEVPIGLVGSNWGGTRIEPWTTLAGFESVPELSKIASQVKGYKADTKVGGGSPTAIYNSMVHPLVPFAMRGGIWYQGESNGGEHMSYYHKKHALVNGWRKAFLNKDLAFYWVQLANFRKPNVRAVNDPKKEFSNATGGDGWARIREAQTKALDIPHTGMAVAIDLADAHNPNDIHPRNKQDVGGRLAQWALHQTYGKKELVPTGPLYKSHKIKGNAIHLTFEHVGKGLMVGKKTKLEPTAEVKDGKLENFAIAGEDKKWIWANAAIVGDTVVVSSKEVQKPVAVRYGFTMNPGNANLYNKDGIAASPFRTDNW